MLTPKQHPEVAMGEKLQELELPSLEGDQSELELQKKEEIAFCAICYEEFKLAYMAVLECKHIFCKRCLGLHLHQQVTTS